MAKGRGDLEQVWARQAVQQRFWYIVNQLSEDERNAIAKDLLLGLSEEMGELVKAVHKPMQYHVASDKSNRVYNQDLLEESVDVFKYLVCLMELYGITPHMFLGEFDRKSAVVDDRRTATCEQLENERVLLVDLDGCLADLEGGFREWMERRGMPTAGESTNQPKFNIPKDEFQRDGHLADLPLLYPNAIDILNNSQLKIIIVTARPQHRFKNVYGDTIQWLYSVGLKYHRIIFTRDKDEAIDMVRPAQIVGMVEDFYKYAMPVALAGVRVFKLPSSSDGMYSFEHPNLKVVSSWEEIARDLEEQDA